MKIDKKTKKKIIIGVGIAALIAGSYATYRYIKLIKERKKYTK